MQSLPFGFPPSESGVELRILKRLFTPEEAGLFLHLTLIPEETRVIAHRAGLDDETTAELLEQMVKKGLCYSIYPESGKPAYQAFHYLCGLWEFQVNALNSGIVNEMAEYWPVMFNPQEWKNAPQMRVIPINKTVTVTHEVMLYEEAEKIINGEQIISLSPCICRQEQEILGKPCKKPSDTCLQFGHIAEFYLHRGVATQITREQALDVLKSANDHGLVLQPSNSKEPAFICCCCSCCCGILHSIKRHEHPAFIVNSSYFARVDENACSGCETCITRCPMEAINTGMGNAVIAYDRCIGCGLCVTTCPSNALKLYRKPASEQKKVPKIWDSALIKLAKDRGKLTLLSMAGMLIRSKVDRIASRFSRPKTTLQSKNPTNH